MYNIKRIYMTRDICTNININKQYSRRRASRRQALSVEQRQVNSTHRRLCKHIRVISNYIDQVKGTARGD